MCSDSWAAASGASARSSISSPPDSPVSPFPTPSDSRRRWSPPSGACWSGRNFAAPTVKPRRISPSCSFSICSRFCSFLAPTLRSDAAHRYPAIRLSRVDRLATELDGRKNTEHDENRHAHELCDQEGRLGLRGRHGFKSCHLRERLRHPDKHIEIDDDYGGARLRAAPRTNLLPSHTPQHAIR